MTANDVGEALNESGFVLSVIDAIESHVDDWSFVAPNKVSYCRILSRDNQRRSNHPDPFPESGLPA
jgi:hypothetical protein